MQFGILYIPDYYPERHKSASHYYGEMLEQIQAAEELGFSSVWFAEHYLDGYAFPSPAIFASTVAQRTTRVRLGTGVTLLPLNHPVRLAQEYAMLDVLSNGRVDLGIGRGVLKGEYELFGVNEAESQARYHESIEIMRRVWTEETLTYAGQFYTLRDLTLLPKPVQKPHPPIWAACAFSPESFTWAGQQGFHAQIVPFFFARPEPLQHLLHCYRQALHEHGHAPATQEVLAVYPLAVTEGAERAKVEAWEHFSRYLHFFAAIARKGQQWQSQAYQAYKGGIDVNALTYEVMEQGNCMIVGDPHECVRRITQAQATYGLTQMIFEINYGGLAHEQVLRSLERFGKDVLPQVRTL